MYRKWMAIALSVFSISPLVGSECDSCNTSSSIFDLCDPCEGWGLYADWLYWRVRKCDLRYAVPYQHSVTEYGKGRTSTLEPDFDSGFRVALTKSCDNFDLAATYSYFNSTEKGNKKSATGSLAPTRLMGGAFVQTYGNNLRFAESSYDIDYHVIDLEMGYHFTVSSERKIHFFSGIKIAQIDQKLDTFYSASQSDFNNNLYDRIKEDVKAEAVGVYAGMEGIWDVGCGFGVYGRVSIATLSAEFDLSNKQTSFDETTLRTINNIKETCRSLVFNTEFRSGLEYRFDTCNCMDWSFSLGYEYHTWVGMEGFLQLKQQNSNLAIPIFDRHSETLGFDGLYLRANVEF